LLCKVAGSSEPIKGVESRVMSIYGNTGSSEQAGRLLEDKSMCRAELKMEHNTLIHTQGSYHAELLEHIEALPESPGKRLKKKMLAIATSKHEQDDLMIHRAEQAEAVAAEAHAERQLFEQAVAWCEHLEAENAALQAACLQLEENATVVVDTTVPGALPFCPYMVIIDTYLFQVLSHPLVAAASTMHCSISLIWSRLRE